MQLLLRGVDRRMRILIALQQELQTISLYCANKIPPIEDEKVIRRAGQERKKDMRSKRFARNFCILAGASLLGFGSCLNLDQILRFGTLYGVSEFLLDGGVLDIFPDGP